MAELDFRKEEDLTVRSHRARAAGVPVTAGQPLMALAVMPLTNQRGEEEVILPC